MPPADDILVEVNEPLALALDAPPTHRVLDIETDQPNTVVLEVVTEVTTFEVGVPGDTHLDLMDGDLFVAADDTLLGTRLRTYTVTLGPGASPLRYTIPASALRLFGFQVNGIDYAERATLTLGTGVVVLDQNGGYVPGPGDGITILYSE